VTFAYPHLLWLLLLPAILLAVSGKQPAAALPFPASSDLTGVRRSWRVRVARLLPWLHGLALVIACIALARPQLVNTTTTVTSKGVDIAVAIDLSTSMLAVDHGSADRSRSRLVIAREVLREFITRRTGDRIGIVVFAARAYPLAPLTLDHDWLAAVLARLEPGTVEDGTALGDGLLAAINRLRSSPSASRAVVVVTDGRSNSGATSPAAAAEAARALGIRVHTIGIGARGGTEFPVEDPLGGITWRKVSADLDEATLKEIAAVTGGSFFRADRPDSLRTVFTEIDRLEKRTFTEKRSSSITELFPWLLLSTLLLFLSEQALRAGLTRRTA